MEQVTTQISGLRYLPNYITRQEHDQLLAIIDQQPWLDTLKRRVQHYGYRYDYKSRSVDASMFLGALPMWIAPLTGRLQREGLVTQAPDQLIVNEYEPGQGISAHVDSIAAFGDTVLSLTLGSACVMLFSKLKYEEAVPLLIEPCSLVIMQGEARYQWKHSIPPRKRDSYLGQTIERARRVSLTFRTVKK
jgi:alkylated DNA repair dioxygenase AlkB